MLKYCDFIVIDLNVTKFVFFPNFKYKCTFFCVILKKQNDFEVYYFGEFRNLRKKETI